MSPPDASKPGASKPGASKPGASKPGGAAAPRPCPICGRPPVQKYHPFCSARCADVDLHRWLSGSYAIPVVEGDDEDDTDLPPR